MDEHTRRMARVRLEELPLLYDDKPVELPDECIEFLLSIMEWVYERGQHNPEPNQTDTEH